MSRAKKTWLWCFYSFTTLHSTSLIFHHYPTVSINTNRNTQKQHYKYQMRLERVHSLSSRLFFLHTAFGKHTFWITLKFHILATRVRYSTIRRIPLKPLSSPPPPRPLSSITLQLLQTQLHQAERHLLCLGSVFGAINARSPICAERRGRRRGYEAGSKIKKEKKRKIPLYVCQGGRKSCNYNIGGFGLQLASSVC